MTVIVEYQWVYSIDQIQRKKLMKQKNNLEQVVEGLRNSYKKSESKYRQLHNQVN